MADEIVVKEKLSERCVAQVNSLREIRDNLAGDIAPSLTICNAISDIAEILREVVLEQLLIIKRIGIDGIVCSTSQKEGRRRNENSKD